MPQKSSQANSGSRIVAGDAQAMKLRPNAMGAMRQISQVRKEVNDMVVGQENPKRTLKKMISRYYASLQRYTWPGASSVEGHKIVKIAYTSSGQTAILSWDYIPSPSGATILAMCPECYRIAPSQVDTNKITKPVFVDGQLGRRPGDPMADQKIVPFQLSYPTFHCWIDDRNPRKTLLSVREVIRCPDYSRCGFVVRINDGVARRVSTNLRSTSKGGPITGPVIVVK